MKSLRFSFVGLVIVLGYIAIVACGAIPGFEDFDGDGYGNPSVPCDSIVESDCVADNTDCDDTDDTKGGPEIPGNDIDENCDGCVADDPLTDPFDDMCDGTVIDNRTNLRWLKHADCFGWQNDWNEATSAATDLEDGDCGLTDGSEATDWRLPTKDEFQGIGTAPQITWATDFPPVGTWTKPGAPFTNVNDGRYYSSTEEVVDYIWTIRLSDGYVNTKGIWHEMHNNVWPVRSDN